MLNKTVGGGVDKVGVFSRTMSFIKFPALIAGAQAAAGAIGALAAAAVQAVSAMVPLVGLMPAMGAGMLAVKQGMGVAKLAMMGVSDALGEISSEGKVTAETMKELAPAARPFVAEMQRLSPEMDRMRDIAAAGLFPGVTDAVRTLSPMIARLRPIVRGTAEVMGDLARRGSQMVSGWGRDISTVGRSNERILNNLGMAGLGVADAFRHILVEVQPLTRWLSRVAVNAAETFREFIAGARKSGELAEFFGRTRDVATELGHSLMNIGTTLANVARAAEPFGREMFASLERVTAGWAQFTGSVRGQNVLTAFFRDAQPAIKEVGLLLKDIVGFFFEMARQQNLGPLIKQIRTEFLPVLKQLGLSAGGELLPALVTLATQVTRLFTTFGTETGVLVTFVKLMGGFLTVVQNLVGENQGLQSTLVTIGAIAGVSQSLGVGQLIQFVAMWRQYRHVQATLTVIQTANAAATNAAAGATTRLSLAARAGAASAAVLSVALMALPFVLVATAVTALVVVIVKNWDRIVHETKARLGFVSHLISERWAAIRDTTVRVWNAIKDFFVNLWHRLIEIARGAWDRLREGVVNLWQRVREIFANGIGAVVGFMRELPGKIINALASLGRMLFNAAKEHLGRFIEGLRDRAIGMLNFFKQLPERILGAIGNLGKLLYNKGKQMVKGLIEGIIDAAKGIGNAVGGAISKGVSALNPLGDGLGILGTAKAGTPQAMMQWAIGKYDSGLAPSSGYRPGAVTASGNTSLHSIPPPNNAWDFAGPAGAMLSAARGLATKFGRGIRELIHTPLGFGIKNGSKVPLSFFGDVVNRMHYSHVHVADRGAIVRGPAVIAQGNITEAHIPLSGSGAKGLRVTGTLQTPFGPAEMEAMVVDVINDDRVITGAIDRAYGRRRR